MDIASSTYRSALTGAGLIALVAATVGIVARYLPITNHFALLAAVISPYLTIGAPLAFVAMALAKRWAIVIVAACLSVACIVFASPFHFGWAQQPSQSATVRVMTANIYLGLADATALAAAASSDADILAVQELTFDSMRHLANAGLDKEFPYRVLYPHDIASGAGLWSRYPISSAKPIPGFEMVFLSARLRVPGVAVDPGILVAHMSGPWPQPITDWREDMNLLPRAMKDAAMQAHGGAVVVAGDFNSTGSMSTFRQLLRNGYSDAAEQANAAWTPTYPSNTSVPPVIEIDHVLLRNCVASAVKTLLIPGSDHRALVATVEIP